MNKPTDGYSPSNRKWWTDRRVICIALVLLAALYVAVEPSLEKMLGIDLPNLVDRGDENDKQAKGDAGDGQAKQESPKFKIDPKMLEGSNKSTSGKASSNNGSKSTPNNTSKNSNAKNGSKANEFKLTEVGRNSYKSPAGLRYTMGARGEHRIEHVMRHAKDQPSRDGPHGVFTADAQDEVLKLLDKAYTMVKTNARGVDKDQGGRNDAYTIDMPNVIGYVGGKAGGRQGKPKTKRMKLVLDGDRVITAYPTWAPRGRR